MRRLRFSLRSLLLAMLLAASAAALVLHYPAWRPVLITAEPFSQFYTLSGSRVVVTEDATDDLKVRNWDGELLYAISHTEFEHNDIRHGYGKYLYFLRNEYQEPMPPKIWDLEKRGWLDIPFKPDEFVRFSDDGRWMLAKSPHPGRKYENDTPSELRLYDLREKKEVMRWQVPLPDELYGYFEDSGDLTVIFQDSIERWDLKTIQRTWEVDMPFPFLSRESTDYSIYSEVLQKDFFLREKKTGKELLHFAKRSANERRWYPATAFMDGDTSLLFIEDDCSIGQIWDISTATKKLDLEMPKFPAQTLDFATLTVRIPADERLIVLEVFGYNTWLVAWNRADGKLLGTWQPRNYDLIDYGSQPLRFVDSDQKLRAVPSGEQLADFGAFENLVLGGLDHDRIFAVCKDPKKPGLYALTRFRPEAWWGVIYLPEFWSTVILALVFLFSLRQTRSAPVG